MQDNLSLSTRLTYLDFLRGIAVLGLLLMNAPLMGVSEFATYIPIDPNSVSDSVVRGLNALFFDGRFRSLFCLLFGIGVYLQYQSYSRRELNAYVILKTRFKWLFLFGLIHALFIWFGDILMLYAMCGWVLLGQLEQDAKTLIKKGTIWFVLGFVIILVISSLLMMSEPTVTRASPEYIKALAITKSGYFSDWQQNLTLVIAFIITFPVFAMLNFGGVMMIGIGLFKLGKLKTGFDKKELTLLITITVFVSLIDAVFAVYFPDIWAKVANILGSVSGFTMALLIWHLVLVSKVHERTGLVVSAIRKVGEMALSFYIMQSLIVTLLLQVIFQQWLTSFSLINFMALSFAVMLAQLILATLYKRPTNQGPLEFVWRKLVNRKIDKLAKEQKQEQVTQA